MKQDPAEIELTLLHTNDMHGSVAGIARAARLARAIRAECAAAGRPCLWWDAGDVEEWTVLESAASQGAAMWALLRAAGVDQATVGNGLLLTYGSGALAGAAAAFGKPVLLAGLTELATGAPSPATAPFALHDLGGLTLGVIAITVAIREYRSLGFQVADPRTVLETWLPRVRAAGADVVAVLSHCGSGRDQELAAHFGPALGWIISAHDHAVYDEPLRVNGVAISETGHRGAYLGRMDIRLGRNGVRALRGTLLPLDRDEPGDPEVEAAWQRAVAAGQAGLDRVVATLAAPAPLDYATESPLANLLADAIRDRTGADLAVILPGHLRHGFAAGPVTVGDMLRTLGTPTHPAVVTLTGAQVRALLEWRLAPARMAAKPMPLRNKPMGQPAVSGLRVTLDPDGPPGARIAALTLLDGTPLDPAAPYRVGSAYYDLHFGVLDEIGPPRPTDLDLAAGPLGRTLTDYLAARSPVLPPPVGRFRGAGES
ncbi:MAG TPA: 5'-nucleotidase C-terminal domain-containing protein [Chloroflexia bacterium]|nr:5'-nucleotidase C-terminal domain-containing protein [Chloroflexia bacterium]